MKHTSAQSLLSCELLLFVRDNNPTEMQFANCFGGSGGQKFHILRKAGAIVVDDGRVRLSRRHLSPDGSYFVWGRSRFLLDRDEIQLVYLKSGGSLVFDNEA